ncbi:MAG: efflux RND transporter periplasmic adaptor subunit [Alphaproteobacteria bacterium]|nr:efflux RND transporter periplasmic adaptor subunit [Alphaproteobacteria bacterium]
MNSLDLDIKDYGEHVKQILLIALVTAVLFAGCSDSGDSDTTTAPKVRPAKLVTVEAASNQRDLSFPAIVQAAQTAELTFQASGEIREINVLEGDEVVAGTVVAKLDQRDALNRLAQTQAEFDNAKIEFERAERLAVEDAIARSELETRKTRRDVTQADLSNSKRELDDTVLTVPFDGFISKVTGRQFQNVQANESIAVLQGAEVEVVVNVPGTIVALSPQFEDVAARVILDDAPDAEIIATLKETSGEADPSTQTYAVSFSFIPPEDIIVLPGMTATLQVSFIFKEDNEFVASGIAVPIGSILAEGEETFVWVVDSETMKISKRKVIVKTGASDDVTVTNGLEGGETLVSAGVSFFHNGMTVRRWTPE